nr:uncharacterized protein LOC127345669 [Lolium perenne]
MRRGQHLSIRCCCTGDHGPLLMNITRSSTNQEPRRHILLKYARKWTLSGFDRREVCAGFPELIGMRLLQPVKGVVYKFKLKSGRDESNRGAVHAGFHVVRCPPVADLFP